MVRKGLIVLSLVVLVMGAWMWRRSYSVADVISWDGEAKGAPGTRMQWVVSSETGRVHVGWEKYGPDSYGMTTNEMFVKPERPMSGWAYWDLQRPSPEDGRESYWGAHPDETPWNRIGFESELVFGVPMYDMGHEFGEDEGGWEWGFPEWLVIAVAGVMPVVGVIGWARRHWRGEQGKCPGCGYDLRASGERCPECGRAVRSVAVVKGAGERRNGQA